MRQLWLQRHAQASGGWPGIDHDRPLSERGILDARRAAELPAAWEIAPARIVCSSAERTETTALIMAQACAPAQEPAALRELYDGSPETYLEVIRGTDETIPSLLLVGHNPTISMLGSALTGSSIGMSPATLLVIELAIEGWDALDASRPGRLVQHWSPTSRG